ncbi:MAG: hypothetical protein KDD10_13810, partial [Phaeodactylibacter sp.]|nr:hypothetical protein [Phaeodactylibacter sp.]
MKRLLPIAGIAALIGTALFFLPLDGNHPAKEESNLIGKIMGRYHQEWLMTHDPATGTIPRERLLRAYKVAQQRRQALGVRSGIIPILWEERGPNNIGGRTRGLIYDANDPTGRTVWAAGVSGGLWRCDDISANPPTWANIDDFFSNLAITTIAQDPNNPNNMYFGTGENGFGNGDAVRGMGIWQSTDGGLTWEQMPAIFISSNPAINKVVVDNASTLFAATNGGLFSFDALTESWDFEMGSGNNVQDIEIAADGTMYATVNGDGIYRFVAPGPWNELTGAPLPASGFGRIETVTAPSNPDVVYAAYESGGFCLNIFRSADGGDNWNTATCPANLGGGNGQLWYDLIMAVDPNDPTRVWVGGVPLYVSGDSGNNWVQATNIHVDHHALVYRPGNSDEMLFGNDGGVYRADVLEVWPDAGWEFRSTGYGVTQFYRAAWSRARGTLVGGTQDNGT